jgi:putative AlgH/UPF0301 family transcriptional regulator
VEGILEKLKIVPEPRNPEIRLDKPVMLGGPLAEEVITVLSEIRMLEEKSEGGVCKIKPRSSASGPPSNKPLENLQVEGILEKLKIVPEPRNPEIRLDKPVNVK